MKKSGFLKYLLWSSLCAIIIFIGSMITLLIYDVTKLPDVMNRVVEQFDEFPTEWLIDWEGENEVFNSNLSFESQSNGGDYYHKSEYPIAEGQNLVFETDVVNADIKVETTTGSELTVEIYTTSPERYRIEQNTSKFLIKEKKRMQPFCLFGCESNKKADIVVKVPSNVTQLDLETVNGDLIIQHSGNLLDAHTVNGMVSLSDSAYHEVDLETVNGILKVLNSQVLYEANLEAVNGSILLQQVESGNTYLQTVNGGMTLTGLKGDILDCETVNGDFELNNIYVRDITVEKLNGSFELINEDQAYEIQSLKLSGFKKNYEIKAKVLNISYN